MFGELYDVLYVFHIIELRCRHTSYFLDEIRPCISPYGPASLFKLVPDQFVRRQRKFTKRLNFLEKFKTSLAGPQDK